MVTDSALVAHVEEAVPGGEVAVPLDDLQLVGALTQVVRQPANLSRHTTGLVAELAKVVAGRSDVAPDPRDWRFVDPAWRDHFVYRPLGKAYLAWAQAVDRLVEEADLDWRTRERARFAATLLTSGLAPTNFLLGNPAALKRAFETGGLSVLKGMRNFARDLVRNRGMPTQVDSRPFRVGETVAVTPGAVVYRDERCELIQYAPSTATVRTRPVVVVPPQINKYYFLDMAPGRSFVEYAVGRGLQVFMVSWRNPIAEHGRWDLESYVTSTLNAVEAARTVTGADAAHLFGFCAGGITAASALAHLAAVERPVVSTASFAVTLLDWHVPSMAGMLQHRAIVDRGITRSSRAGVLDGKALGQLFSLLRPNDLVWNYWVNNNLLGQDPPAFDILAWNADSTRMPAALHADFLDLFLNNSLVFPGRVQALGTPLDLSAVTCDNYVVGGQTDHLTPWKGCYATTQLLGGASRFVLTSSGHIQSLVNPPGNPKMRLHTGPDPGPDPDAWLAAATSAPGTWWDDWADWITLRSGDDQAAPSQLGGHSHPPLDAAPGRYVHDC